MNKIISKKNLKYLTQLTKITYLLFLLFFASGFLIWNTYLARFGFQEYEIIQTRFVLTGFFFYFISFIVFIILNLIWLLLKPLFLPLIKLFITKTLLLKLKQIQTPRFYLMFIPLFFIALVGYAYLLFPMIPMSLGGSHPEILSILATENEIDYLSKFGIKKGERSEIQTENLCLAYQNKDTFIILRNDRVLQFKKEIIKGFGSIPDDSKERKEFIKFCRWLASERWLLNE